MWTWQFKIQPAVTFFTAIKQCSKPFRKQSALAQRLQKFMFKLADFDALCRFLYNFGQSGITVIIMIDISKTLKLLVGFGISECACFGKVQ